MSKHILFVQKRSARAGAQVSLSRLAGSNPLRPFHPAVLLGTEGWLIDHLRESGTPHAKVSFPSPRAFTTRLTGLRPFGRRAVAALTAAGIQPSAVIANDHQEVPLALEISRRSGGAPVIGILRSSGLSLRDFEKYECERCDVLMAVGDDLFQRITPWTHHKPLLFTEGFSDAEFHEPIPPPQVFPERILVVGSEDITKGFSDFLEALDLIEAEHPDFPALVCDFTGTIPQGVEALAARPRRAKLNFMGRVNGFVALVRSYALVVHPSREETFGMAPLEAILAGTPTLFTRTGVAQTMDVPDEWCIAPCQPRLLADQLVRLWRHWPDESLDLHRIQEEIRTRFHIDHTSRLIARSLGKD